MAWEGVRHKRPGGDPEDAHGHELEEGPPPSLRPAPGIWTWGELGLVLGAVALGWIVAGALVGVGILAVGWLAKRGTA